MQNRPIRQQRMKQHHDGGGCHEVGHQALWVRYRDLAAVGFGGQLVFLDEIREHFTGKWQDGLTVTAHSDDDLAFPPAIFEMG